MTYPDHHDLSMHDIPDRSGDPLMVGKQSTIDMLARVAYNAWRQMGSTHNAAPCAQALSDRIMHPRPGDPVYVPDSFGRHRDEDTRRKGVGYLVVERVEWYHSDEAWLSSEEGEDLDHPWSSPFGEWTDGEPLVWNPLTHPKRPTEKVFYVQYGPNPGDICRWENASCYAIPYGDEMMGQIDEAARRIVAAQKATAGR